MTTDERVVRCWCNGIVGRLIDDRELQFVEWRAGRKTGARSTDGSREMREVVGRFDLETNGVDFHAPGPPLSRPRPNRPLPADWRGIVAACPNCRAEHRLGEVVTVARRLRRDGIRQKKIARPRRSTV